MVNTIITPHPAIDFPVFGVYTNNIYDTEGKTKWKQQNYFKMAVLKQ